MDRKSTTGGLFLVHGNPVGWLSKKQGCVTLSTTEAEYVAASIVSAELISIKGVVEDIIKSKVSANLNVDNQGAIYVAKNLESRRTRHIHVRYHYVRELLQLGIIEIDYIETENNLADYLTKSFVFEKFKVFLRALY